jgi:sugar/nucleoside kinase (ribokinase family)
VQLNAAGSLANTLAGCALLGRAHSRHAGSSQADSPCIAMAGPIGDDHLGQFFQSHMSSTGVQWIERPLPSTGTGTVIVLTTPDAQRSFLSFPGPPAPLSLSESTCSAIAASRCLVIEGYLWEFPDAVKAIGDAIKLAKASGGVVAMTTADVSVVRRFRKEMIEAMEFVDVMFTNADEACALVSDGVGHKDTIMAKQRSSSIHSAEDAALQLGRLCPVAVVTDGSKGSCVTALGQLYIIPPHWSRNAPIDTCGAGDGYAAGFLHGYLSGMTVREMGELAAATASAVISHQGPQLLPEHALKLAACHHPVRRRAMASFGEFEANRADWTTGHAWECGAIA